MDINVDLSIIVPTYNERKNLEELVERIDSVLKSAKIFYEIIIVDDNSPDGTARYAEKLSKKYPIKVLKRPRKMGLSSAILDGLKIAESKIIAVMDADLQHPPEILSKMFEKLRKNDVVIASRYVKGGSIGKWSLLRKIVSRVATIMARTLIPKIRGIRDPLSGYFMFRQKIIDGVEINPHGFKILLEILVKGRTEKICEIPYIFGTRFRGRSKLNINEIIRFLIYIVDLAPEYIRFLIIGACGTLVNLGTLALLIYFNIPHIFASAIAIEVSIIHNLIGNNIWTFKGEKGKWINRLIKFHLSSITALIIQWITSCIIYYKIINISILAQLIGILLGFPANYTLSKKYIWKKHKH